MTATPKFSTDMAKSQYRSSEWAAVVSEAYFPLELNFHDQNCFSGKLTQASFGHVAIARLTSDAVRYERRRSHIKDMQEEEYIITFPRASAVDFCQMGRDVRCPPGGFIIERSDEPYCFLYERFNDLYTLKVNRRALAERVRHPDRFCAQAIDASTGTAGLFATMVSYAQSQADNLAPAARGIIGRQILELLGFTLSEASEASVCEGRYSSVRTAHLARIEAYIRANLKDPNLSPGSIAKACGISKRYLHALFQDMNSTVSRQIRDQRLVAARDELQSVRNQSISEIAYRFGFSDQAQFSRLFKAKFSISPSEFQRNSLEFLG